MGQGLDNLTLGADSPFFVTAVRLNLYTATGVIAPCLHKADTVNNNGLFDNYIRTSCPEFIAEDTKVKDTNITFIKFGCF